MTPEELLHIECQGNRDSGFSERVLWYHVGFALRYRSERRVRTVALWLIPLPSTQPRNEVAAGESMVSGFLRGECRSSTPLVGWRDEDIARHVLDDVPRLRRVRGASAGRRWSEGVE
jgi:hypothetical protein